MPHENQRNPLDNPKAKQEKTEAQRGQLEEGMATPSSVLAWRIPWPEEPGGPQARKESDTTEQLSVRVQRGQVARPKP